MIKCEKCGKEIAGNTEAFYLNRAQWGGDERFCDCYGAGIEPEEKMPDVELVTVDSLKKKWTIYYSEAKELAEIKHDELLICPEDFDSMVKEIQQNQRQVDAKICRGIIKELHGWIMPEFDDRIIEILQSLCSKLEGAAEAIEEGK